MTPIRTWLLTNGNGRWPSALPILVMGWRENGMLDVYKNGEACELEDFNVTTSERVVDLHRRLPEVLMDWGLREQPEPLPASKKNLSAMQRELREIRQLLSA
jgi:hypothetical protein